MAELTFDIDGILNDSVNSGVLTKKQVSEIKKKRTAAPVTTKESTSGSQAAGVAGLVGQQIQDADTGGTDTTSQTVGGAASGAATGFAVAGPWGAAVGGVIGGIQGALGADANREKANQQAEAKRVSSVANIQNSATQARNAQVNNLINSLSTTLLR